MGCCHNADHTLRLEAPTVDCGARLLIAVLCWVHAGGSIGGGRKFLTAMRETTKSLDIEVTGPLHLAHMFWRDALLVKMYVLFMYFYHCP